VSTRPDERAAALAEGRRADTARRRQRVLVALAEAAAGRAEISVSGIARHAGVDRTFLYRHRDLLEKLHALEAQLSGSPDASLVATRASLESDLHAAQHRAARLAARVQHLERRLSELLGERTWQDSGLGAPDDIDRLHQRIASLEAQIADLRIHLDERTEELTAARLANRELMTRLNGARST
jgi:chromosome segregation ATPase